MKKNQHPPQKKPVTIHYDRQSHGWVVAGAGKHRVFATRADIENFCIKKLGSFPVCLHPPKEYQQLPRNSVWTGAPWDRTFANIIK